MANTAKPDSDNFLTQRKLAERWKCSQRTLQRWRTQSYGPAFLRLGGSVRYCLADVLAFEDRSRSCEVDL